MFRYSHLCLVVILGCAVVLVASPVWAQVNVEAARAKFQEGQALFAKQEYAQAAQRFREAYDLSPNWRLLYNIAQCEAAGRQYGMAMETFERYLAEGGDDLPSERESEIVEEISKLRARVGGLRVQGPAGAVVTLGGVMRGTLPLPGTLRASAGIRQTLKVTLDQRVLLERDIRIGSEEIIDIEVPVARAGEAVTMASEETVSPVPADMEPMVEESGASRPLRSVGFVLSSTGAGVLIGGITAGLVAMSRASALEDACEGIVCPPEKKGSWESANRAATISTVLYPVGGVLAATGVVLLLVDRKRNAGERITMTPVMSSDTLGVALTGRF